MKYRNHLNNANEGEFLVRKADEVSRILEEKIYDMPALEYAGKIKYANIYDVVVLDNLVRKMFANYLNWDEKRKIKRRQLLLQLIFPFGFWTFRGIETLFVYMSEVLAIMGVKARETERKTIQLLAYIGGAFGFLGSLASILSFLGLGFENN